VLTSISKKEHTSRYNSTYTIIALLFLSIKKKLALFAEGNRFLHLCNNRFAYRKGALPDGRAPCGAFFVYSS
jgi:hypothetical protein